MKGSVHRPANRNQQNSYGVVGTILSVIVDHLKGNFSSMTGNLYLINNLLPASIAGDTKSQKAIFIT